MQLVKYLTLLVIIAWAASNGQKCHREIKSWVVGRMSWAIGRMSWVKSCG